MESKKETNVQLKGIDVNDKMEKEKRRQAYGG